MHIIEVGIKVVAQTEIVIRIHDISHAAFHIVVIDIAPYDRHRIHRHDTCSRLVLIAEGMRQAESDVHVALRMKSF